MTPDDTAIRQAADKLRESIALKLGDLADDLLDRPEFGSTEWKADYDARETPEGQAKLAQWSLTKIRICRAADLDPLGNVLNARKFGATWDEIGDAAGISHQAAAEQWDKYADRINGRCSWCGQPMEVPDRPQGGGRTKRFCSEAHKQAAHRAARQATSTPADPAN